MFGTSQSGLRVRLGPPKWWTQWASRLLVFGGIPLLLIGAGYLFGLHRGEQVAPRNRAVIATSGATNQDEEAFAARFATAYLTYDQSHPQEYQSRLQAYVASSLDPGTFWNGQGSQRVAEALPVSVARLGHGVDRVTVAALIEDGGWLYLGVPVHADGNSFVVVAQPALLPAPGRASWSPPGQATEDPRLSTQLRGDLAAFFTAYAASDSAQLGYYTTPGAHLGGLHGAVTLAHLDRLTVDQGGKAERTATAQVTWQPQGEPGTALQESYQLTLVHRGPNWLVSTLTPAGGA